MANYRLDDGGYIQNPETKKNDDIYEVTLLADKLEISLPHINDYVRALNDARDYKKKCADLQKRIDAIGPNLRHVRHFLEAMYNALPPRDHRESKERLTLTDMINCIDEILRSNR